MGKEQSKEYLLEESDYKDLVDTVLQFWKEDGGEGTKLDVLERLIRELIIEKLNVEWPSDSEIEVASEEACDPDISLGSLRSGVKEYMEVGFWQGVNWFSEKIYNDYEYGA